MSDTLPTVHSRYTDEQIAAFYASGHWQASSFFSVATDKARSGHSRTFVFDGTTSLTYGEFHERTVRLAAGLAAIGIGRGDRVAVQLPNWTEFPLVAAALSRIGAITVPIMPIYRDDEVGYVLDHSGAVAAVTADTFRGFDHRAMFQSLQAGRDHLKRIIVARGEGGDLAGATALESLFAEGDPSDLDEALGPDSSPDDGFLIVYTSGTTARPKGCFHTFNTLRASAAAIGASLRYTAEDVQFGPSPITHSTGLVTSVVLPLLAGASSHLMEAWDPQEGLARIERHGCTVAVTATPFLQMLMAAYDPAKHDPASMRAWVCAGSPIPGAVVEQARQVLPCCRTLSLYGRSENFLTTMCTIEDPPERAVLSDGSALAGARVRVVGPDGLELPRGEEGDLAYRGPSHMIEYFRDEEQTAALFTPDGFSRSGDLGRMDADGFVRVTGRIKDIIIRGGMNISAREIEDHLLTHPAIASVAVVGMPDERLGEKACAFVVLAPGADSLALDDVTDYLRAQRVAVQKVPERLEIVSALPMTATGKVRKHVLRAEIRRRLVA
ncbi:Cyclohexanecarboxylate-CoA ligase [Frankia canadensis]|uniref:Cyclohexanecarboxylate-CoA ligase n=1 Tax=Frankia canadensis TaxID=1836972 RepID=A0A2I2KPU8_9ACTN|nr:AMP-binding protein [Frankia canadensis]SNQ47697.1 Cyclohexanecarboxylate-CoA ligase [Frankia canadensis]SOU54987.1 Cyclohexanecarboxylate-CoA ligase [Frankia canadensis]